MNKKGQTLGIAVITMIFILLIGFTMTYFLMDEIDVFRTAMNCATPAAISDGTKLLCLVVDTTIPYWIVLIISITIGTLIARMNS